jgi:hypothetical protein
MGLSLSLYLAMRSVCPGYKVFMTIFTTKLLFSRCGRLR